VDKDEENCVRLNRIKAKNNCVGENESREEMEKRDCGQVWEKDV